jgi:hypothetical protein
MRTIVKQPAFTRITLPRSFREIRLELAREPGHPTGSAVDGYTIIAPLDAENRIDAKLWQAHRAACRVVRFRHREDDDVGHLVHRPGGSWAFSYDIKGDEEDEDGFNFENERFELGEYVSIHEDDGPHTFRVTSVLPI